MNRVHKMALVVMLVVALLLSACVAPAAQPGAGSSGAAASDQKVKIRWWHIWGGSESSIADNWQKLADEYMAAHPNVEIEITVITGDPYKDKLASNMQAGDPPDLFQTWGGGVLWQYADAGLVQDLSDALAQDGWGDTFLLGQGDQLHFGTISFLVRFSSGARPSF